MKTLIAAAMLLALAIPAHAETCTGPVRLDVVTVSEGLHLKGDKVFSVGGCGFEQPALQKRILRSCPIGSNCRVEGSSPGDGEIATIDSVTRMRR